MCNKRSGVALRLPLGLRVVDRVLSVDHEFLEPPPSVDGGAALRKGVREERLRRWPVLRLLNEGVAQKGAKLMREALRLFQLRRSARGDGEHDLEHRPHVREGRAQLRHLDGGDCERPYVWRGCQTGETRRAGYDGEGHGQPRQRGLRL
eukprot:scaffold76379_cov28-Tisochrysis_lutea.AAC.3